MVCGADESEKEVEWKLEDLLASKDFAKFMRAQEKVGLNRGLVNCLSGLQLKMIN